MELGNEPSSHQAAAPGAVQTAASGCPRTLPGCPLSTGPNLKSRPLSRPPIRTHYSQSRGRLPGFCPWLFGARLAPLSCQSYWENLKAVFVLMSSSFPWTRVNHATKINGEPWRLVLKDGPSCGLWSVTRHPLARERGVLVALVSSGPTRHCKMAFSTAHPHIIPPLFKAS